MPTQKSPGSSSGKENLTRLMVEFDGKSEKPIELTAYAFDRNGKLAASIPVKGNYADLPLHEKAFQEARIFFGPAIPEARGKSITLETMSGIKAYEPVLKFEPNKRQYEILPIPEFYWKWWFWCHCRVRGQVVKPITIGGVSYEKPVCNARVHICEADRLYFLLPRLPEQVIWKLRDELLQVIERPIPFPEPDPEPFKFDPGVIDPSPINIAKMNLAQAPTLQSEQFAGASGKNFGSEVMLSPHPLPPKGTAMQLNLETRAALLSSSPTIVRQALLDNIQLIRPWICYWRWFWPYFCTCEEVAVVTTDEFGRFDASVWYQCFGDHPDLYFWVEYSIGGVWTPVYRPLSVCCHTYWNYACGSEVTLRVTDPRVRWCGGEPELPGKQVAILSIGHEISMTEILGQSAGANEGLVSAIPGYEAPMGGSLEPYAFFGDGLIPSGITHYRWSYQKLGSSPANWKALDTTVIRHYAEVKANGSLTFKPFTLGADTVFPGQNLFKIRPVNPPAPGGSVVSTSWAPEVDARQNTASAFFQTHLLEGGNALLAAGKYELKLELFKSTGGVMTPIDFASEGVLIKVPTGIAPFGPDDVPTVDVVSNLATAGIGGMEDRVFRNAAGHVVGFRLVVHVDNNHCFAEIKDVSVNGAAAGDCGFIEYTPGSNAVVKFVASHPNRFARFNFNTFKGSCGDVTQASASGKVGDSPVFGFVFTSGPDEYHKNVPVSDLLNGGACGTTCDKAAFGENLKVETLATDGWSRLNYLDSPTLGKAFALEPAPAPVP